MRCSCSNTSARPGRPLAPPAPAFLSSPHARAYCNVSKVGTTYTPCTCIALACWSSLPQTNLESPIAFRVCACVRAQRQAGLLPNISLPLLLACSPSSCSTRAVAIDLSSTAFLLSHTFRSPSFTSPSWSTSCSLDFAASSFVLLLPTDTQHCHHGYYRTESPIKGASPVYECPSC